MRCYICDQDDPNKWRELDGIHKDSVLIICKACGNLCHKLDTSKEAEMLAYYKKEYRRTPSHINIITTTNKLQYIELLLRDYLKDKKDLVCGDVGAATGYVLNWLKNIGHKVTGSEYTILMRRMSEHYYGIPLTEELREDWAYDLLVVYHVLEHMMNPDKKLEKLVGLLKEEGRILVSTPFWLDALDIQDGSMMGQFEAVYHKNHINTFSKNQLMNVFRKVGLWPEKEEMFTCGQTYVLKKSNKKKIEPEDWQRVEEIVRKQKQAIELYLSGKADQALKIYPDFPEAHIFVITRMFGKDPERQQDAWDNIPVSIKNNRKIVEAKIKWLYQYNRMDECLLLCEAVMGIVPQADTMYHAGLVLARLGRHKEAMSAWQWVLIRQPQMWPHVIDLQLASAAAIPAWDERAKEEAKNILFEKAVQNKSIEIKLIDSDIGKPNGTKEDHKTSDQEAIKTDAEKQKQI